MRTTLDFAPLYRTGIGFDRLLNALEAASRVATFDNWPPYDIAKTGENEYRISMAVAGFTKEDLSITQEQNLLLVVGHKSGDGEGNGEYLYRGIAGRAFQRRFELADHVKVVSASLVNGMLVIDLKRELPEQLKPRRIAIGTDVALSKPDTTQILAERTAA
jgi:molecular chaperone IbpA